MDNEDVSMPSPDGSKDVGGDDIGGDVVRMEPDGGCPRPGPAGCLRECRFGSDAAREIRRRTYVEGISSMSLSLSQRREAPEPPRALSLLLIRGAPRPSAPYRLKGESEATVVVKR